MRSIEYKFWVTILNDLPRIERSVWVKFNFQY